MISSKVAKSIKILLTAYNSRTRPRLHAGGGHWGLRYCGIGQFFMRYFGNFNFKLRYCGVLRICGMRYFWRFGQRYLVKKEIVLHGFRPFDVRTRLLPFASYSKIYAFKA